MVAKTTVSEPSVNQPGKSKILNKESRLLLQINRLGDTFKPVFGQSALFVVLLVSTLVVFETNLLFKSFERGVPVSIIGFLVPASLLSDGQLFSACKACFYFSAFVWFSLPFLKGMSARVIRVLISISTWSSVLTYTIVASMYWENLPFFLHKYVLPAWLLLIHSFWYHFYREEISTSIEQRNFWSTPLYPRWVFLLSVFVISMLYTFAGFSKLRVAPDWGNGLSLQLWTFMFGDKSSPVTDFILANRLNSAIVQCGTLLVECLAILALLHPFLRTAIGAGLLAMHGAVYVTFHIDFVPNMILIIVYFMPLFEWSHSKTRC